jgi:hypothetical protein
MASNIKALSISLLLSLAFQLTTIALANTTEASATPKNSAGKVLVETAKFPGRVVTASAGSAIGLTGGMVVGVLAAPILAPLSLLDCESGYCRSFNKREAVLRVVTTALIAPPGVGFIATKKGAKIGWHAWDSKE